MDKRYRMYTQEFKLEALELLKHSGKSAAQLERELGITKGLLLKSLPAGGEGFRVGLQAFFKQPLRCNPSALARSARARFVLR